MGAIDWESLLATKVEDIADNEELQEGLFDILSTQVIFY